jgi:glyoxylase-like metal-dependent hydrolase (beta-lactamase superfamily II)
MIEISMFTGGIFDTNAYLIEGEGILVDAPQGVAEWVASRGVSLSWLLITHGHIDHVVEAARIKREHGCKVAYHADGIPMLTDADFFKKLGFGWEIEPVEADRLIDESPREEFAGIAFQTLLVPGHCPGSLCFFQKESGTLFGGDVLFAGGVGRWDLPGGDSDLLFSGIRSKIYTLDPEVKVLPGHGPMTTVGRERESNPFVRP